MGKNIEDVGKSSEAASDVTGEPKKRLDNVERAPETKERSKTRKRKITLDDVEPTTTVGADDSMGMSQNMREHREND